MLQSIHRLNYSPFTKITKRKAYILVCEFNFFYLLNKCALKKLVPDQDDKDRTLVSIGQDSEFILITCLGSGTGDRTINGYTRW